MLYPPTLIFFLLIAHSYGLHPRQALPNCAANCYFYVNGNGINCAASDIVCMCQSAILIQEAAQCTADSCSVADFEETAETLLGICAAAGVYVDTQSVTTGLSLTYPAFSLTSPTVYSTSAVIEPSSASLNMLLSTSSIPSGSPTKAASSTSSVSVASLSPSAIANGALGLTASYFGIGSVLVSFCLRIVVVL